MLTVEELMKLPWNRVLVSSGSGWAARISDLPGCVSQGVTPNEANENLNDALEGWLTVSIEHQFFPIIVDYVVSEGLRRIPNELKKAWVVQKEQRQAASDTQS